MAYEVELQRDAARYSDMCQAASRLAAVLDDSQERCAKAVAAIKAIRGMTARDVCNVIEALHSAMTNALHGDEADTAIEFLMDAHSVAERIAESEEA